METAMTDVALTSHTPIAHPSRLLRRALAVDAALSALSGALMTIDAAPLNVVLGLPTELLRGAGLSLLPWAALVGWLATRPLPPRRAVWAMIGLNALWALDSALLLVSDLVSPTGLGVAFVIVQALAVAGLAALQYLGLRRSSQPALAPAAAARAG
jgi:hypothetical protein